MTAALPKFTPESTVDFIDHVPQTYSKLLMSTQDRFTIGDKVKLLDVVGEFTVVRTSIAQIVVEDEWGMELSYPENAVLNSSRIMDYSSPSADDAANKEHALNIKKSKPAVRSSSARHQPETWEIDLHLEALYQSSQAVTKSYQHALAAQISAFRSFLKLALAERQTKIVVIHGDGDGVLKNEIHLALLQMEKVSFQDADYQTYGTGATIIELSY